MVGLIINSYTVFVTPSQDFSKYFIIPKFFFRNLVNHYIKLDMEFRKILVKPDNKCKQEIAKIISYLRFDESYLLVTYDLTTIIESYGLQLPSCKDNYKIPLQDALDNIKLAVYVFGDFVPQDDLHPT